MIFDIPAPPTADAIILKQASDTHLSSQSMIHNFLDYFIFTF